MTPAEATLDAGFDTLLSFHGETLTWRSGSGVVLAESGEAVTDSNGQAVESGGADEIEFTGIFDSEYELFSPTGGGVATTVIAVSAKSATLPDAARGDLIDRGTTTYYVVDVQEDGVGVTRLILSKHAH